MEATSTDGEVETWSAGAAPLRAATLLYLPEKEAEVLEWAVRACIFSVTETLPMPDVRYRRSEAKGHLRAALLDLQATARFLRYACRHSVEVMDSPPAEEALGEWAGELAAELEALAAQIEARIGPGAGKAPRLKTTKTTTDRERAGTLA